jgi:hypothetical protein
MGQSGAGVRQRRRSARSLSLLAVEDRAWRQCGDEVELHALCSVSYVGLKCKSRPARTGK